MKKRDYEHYDIEYRIKRAMSLMKVIMELSDNEIEKHEADYCYHKLENLQTTSKVLSERDNKGCEVNEDQEDDNEKE